MCFTVDQIERACGLLLLDFNNTFIYVCKRCQCEFDSGLNLEGHFLSEHQVYSHDTVFVSDSIFVDDIEPAPIKCDPINHNVESYEGNFEVTDKLNVQESNELKYDVPNVSNAKEPSEENLFINEKSSDEEDDDKPLADFLDNHDSDSYGNSDEPRKFKDEVSIIKKRRGRPCGWRKKRDSTSDESYTLEREKLSVRKSRGRPPKSNEPSKKDKPIINKPSKKSKNNLNSTEATPKRPVGRPFGSKNKNYAQNDVVKTYSKDEEVENPNKRGGRPTTGIFYCEMCPTLVFDGKMNLKKHMYHCHIRQKWCDICKVRPRQSYERHMEKHHSDEVLKCQICEATFKKIVNLKVHMRIHTRTTQFLCVTCGKSFPSKALCRQHENTKHNNIRNFKCEYCDSAFHFRYRLHDHINAFHTKEKPHKCDICGKGFSNRNYARVHRVTHGEKELQCRYCDKMFKLSGNRLKHEILVHHVVKVNTRD